VDGIMDQRLRHGGGCSVFMEKLVLAILESHREILPMLVQFWYRLKKIVFHGCICVTASQSMIQLERESVY
jgi:hypothetical protein